MSYNAKTDRNLSKTKLKDNDFMLLLDQIKSAETWLSSPVSYWIWQLMIWVFKLSQYDSIGWHLCKDQVLNYLMIDILFEGDRCI